MKKRFILLGIAVFFGVGCSGKMIHKNLSADPKILVREWTLKTKTDWMAGEKSAEFSNPVFFENTLIFGSTNLGLVSIYPGLNQKRWVLPISNGIISELTVSGSSVFFGGSDGFLYSVNAVTGRINWRYELRNPVISRPTVKDGRLFVTTSDDTLFAFDAASGQWLWHYKRRSAQTSSILGASAPLVEGDDVIAGLSDGFLVAVSINDGKLKWEKRLHPGQKFTDVDAEPIFDGKNIFISSYDGAFYSLDRKSGRVIWKFDSGGSKRVELEGNQIFLPASDGTVYALNKESSKVIWKFELDSGIPTQLAVTPDYIFVGSSYQYLYVLDKITGKPLYRFNAGDGSGFLGAPAYDPRNNRIYILSNAGNLYAFSIRLPMRPRPHGKTDPYLFTQL